MATLTESNLVYPAGVYRLETTDAATGGEGGKINEPLVHLANRTAYLKARVDAFESGATLPPTLAALDSPTFTGDPKCPTAGSGDNDTSLANTAFVQATVSGRLSRSVAGSINIPLTAIESGNAILDLYGALTANIAIIVQANPTKSWIVKNNTTGAFTLTVKTTAGTGVVVMQGKTAFLYCDGVNVFDGCTDVLANILAVDGAGSGIDADLLDGMHGSAYARSGTNTDITSISGNAATATTAANLSGTWASLPAGTRMPFAQAVAPTGWTQDTTDNANNRMLRVVNTAGGGVAGSHSPILNNVVPIHTHGFSGTSGAQSADHAHYTSGTSDYMNQNSSHAHGVYDPGHSHVVGSRDSTAEYGGNAGNQEFVSQVNSIGPNVATSGSGTGISIYGADTNHTHNWAGWSGGVSANHTHGYSGNTDGGSSQVNWAPRYIDMIICSKN